MGWLESATSASVDNAEHIFKMILGMVKNEAQAKSLARQITNYGIKCWRDGAKFERQKKQRST